MPTPFVAQPGMTVDESFPVRDGSLEIWHDSTSDPGGHEWAVVLTHTTVKGPIVLWHGKTRDTAAIVASVLKNLLYEQGHAPDPLEPEGHAEVSMWCPCGAQRKPRS